MQIRSDMLSGKTERHLRELSVGCLLHEAAIEPFMDLKAAATQQGFDLQVASGFRSYKRQLAIWNAKARGQRQVLADNGQPINLSRLDDREKAFAILRWSALPGCSRHHWGTDIDIWDAGAVVPDYVLQLTPAEYQRGGPFYDLRCWLDDHAEAYGFAEPFAIDQGGVAPEPWHLSYAPVAQQFETQVDLSFIRDVLDNSELVLRDTILANLDEIFSRFISPGFLSKPSEKHE